MKLTFYQNVTNGRAINVGLAFGEVLAYFLGLKNRRQVRDYRLIYRTMPVHQSCGVCGKGGRMFETQKRRWIVVTGVTYENKHFQQFYCPKCYLEKTQEIYQLMRLDL
jgi:hypothetical protein